MENQERHLTIFSELENLQNDLLKRLDDLDRRVKQVLDDWTMTRKEEKKAG